MLVLRRKESEQIVIGQDIVVTVSKICGNRVQLAISAPEGIRILRAELIPFEHTGPLDAEMRECVLVPVEKCNASWLSGSSSHLGQ